MFYLQYEEKMYAIVIARRGGDRRLFGRIRRSRWGDLYVVWAEDESPDNPAQGADPHASYHATGQLHFKMSKRVAFFKRLQILTRNFRGNEPIDATNADRALSPTLPVFAGQFDDEIEISLDLISGNPNQSIAVDLTEPGVPPAKVNRADRVLAEKTFDDDVPWIIVRLVEPVQ
jgi:hypothetical protein